MKLKYLDENNFVIYINKNCIKDLDIENKSSVEDYFKKMFAKLKNNYHLDISGNYHIRVYADKQYGIIVDILKMYSDFYRLYNNKIDMKIIIDTNNAFLYETEDYFVSYKVKDKIKSIYFKDNKYYFELNDNIDDKAYYYLLENTDIIYDEEVDEILLSGYHL